MITHLFFKLFLFAKQFIAAEDSQFKMRLLSLLIEVHYLNINVNTIGFILVPDLNNEFENNVFHIYLIYIVKSKLYIDFYIPLQLIIISLN